MSSLKQICDAYDTTYELEGKKLKKAVEELKIMIEEKIQSGQIVLTFQEIDWLTWIYGKISKEFMSEPDTSIIDYYTNTVAKIYDERAKIISEKHHFTNMYDVMECEDF